MKKLLTLLALIATTAIFAQAPQGFNYQATVRNSSGALIVNQNVLVKFNVFQNSATGTLVYSENQTANTDDLGHIALVVGQGTATTGTFSSINWGSGSYFLGIELNTGNGFVDMGTTQLLSVPYALYALNAENTGNSLSIGKSTVFITGNITNEQAATKLLDDFGTNTDNIIIRNTTGLTSIDLSSVKYLNGLKIELNKDLTSINLNGLINTYGYVGINSNRVLTSLNFPLLESFLGEGISVQNNNSLNAISFPKLKEIEYALNLNANALPSTQINSILNKLLSVTFLDSSSYYITLNQSPPAPPSGQGIIDKATLINKGIYLSTD
jgi:hypothetical protein